MLYSVQNKEHNNKTTNYLSFTAKKQQLNNKSIAQQNNIQIKLITLIKNYEVKVNKHAKAQ